MSQISVADANYLWSRDLLTALVRQGVQHAVISSGSRCAPLVLAASRTKGLRLWTHLDERSAGFIGLGIGKATRNPAVLICTSGTAAANYFPAVIEARLSRTPLLVLTADRPPELRHCGAPQTIDQIDLYGRYPHYFCDLPVPESANAEKTRWTEEAERAFTAAIGCPGGPVHLNVPFREPLIPAPASLVELDRIGEIARAQLATRPARSCSIPGAGIWDSLADKIRVASRGIIICGPQNSCDDLGLSVSRLASASGYPVFADVASQVRFGECGGAHVVSHYDLFLKNSQLARDLAPEMVIRIGGLPTSTTLNIWLKESSIRDHVLIDDQASFADPFECATWTVTSPLAAVGEEIGRRLKRDNSASSAYSAGWCTADSDAMHLLHSRRQETTEMFAGDVVAAVFEHASVHQVVYLSNSMAIRFAETYAQARNTPIRVLFNRGANGIDGVVSSALGAAAGLDARIVLVTGDVTLLHDINGLSGARQNAVDLKVILLNDNGGGIFSYLPISAHSEIFDPLVAMPHGRDFSEAARFCGVPHNRFSSLGEFVSGYRACLERRGTEIIEVQYDRKRSHDTGREIYRRFKRGEGVGP